MGSEALTFNAKGVGVGFEILLYSGIRLNNANKTSTFDDKDYIFLPILHYYK